MNEALKEEKFKNISKILLGLSLLLYVASCLTTALIFKREGAPDEFMPGWNVLAVGWVGVLLNQWGWFANPFWLVALVCGFLRFFKAGKIIVCTGLVISVVSIVMLYSQEIPANEGMVGPPSKLSSLGIGFWLWMAAQLFTLAGNFGPAKANAVSGTEGESSKEA